MIRKVLFIFSFIAFVSTSLLAQQQITGKVTDENGEPIVGANVVIKGTNDGTITNIDGAFNLSAPEGSTLLVSFVGYTTQEVATAGNTNLEIVLQPDDNALYEVVVTALGIKREQKRIAFPEI